MSVSDSMEHLPVLRDAVVDRLALQPGAVIVDGTVGPGGHAEALLRAEPRIRLMGIDRDRTAIERAKRRLERYGPRVTLVQGAYERLDRILDTARIGVIDGLLLDLGISTLQLDDVRRGFSFRRDGPLDMRMNRETGEPASAWLATASAAEIADVLRRYGEERYARRIAQAIVESRHREPIVTTGQLATIVRAAVPAAYRRQRIDPATRSFQAIRILVNDELRSLESGLHVGFDRLRAGGVMVVISFHSLEDRIVKRFFAQRAASCICPPDLPECLCGKEIEAEILTKHPVTASPAEVEGNPRARSAKLRAARKVV